MPPRLRNGIRMPTVHALEHGNRGRMLGQVAFAGEPGFRAAEDRAVAVGQTEQPVDPFRDRFPMDVHYDASLQTESPVTYGSNGSRRGMRVNGGQYPSAQHSGQMPDPLLRYGVGVEGIGQSEDRVDGVDGNLLEHCPHSER